MNEQKDREFPNSPQCNESLEMRAQVDGANLEIRAPFLGRRRFLALTAAAALLPRKHSMAREESMAACLGPGVWERVETTVDNALEGIAGTQGPNGELGVSDTNPACTAMCVMAFLSRGHAPGRGKYGDLLEKAVDSVIARQDERGVIGPRIANHQTYTHGMSGLMLGEVYGRMRQGQSLRVREAIIKALSVTRLAQVNPKQAGNHKGGIRYFNNLTDSDLSCTGWHFMFYRSAKNAEFDVPEAWVTEMLQFVNACKSTIGGGFGYQPAHAPSFAMSAVGLLCMTMVGRNDHPLAVSTAQMLQRFEMRPGLPRLVYGMYYASLAMAQMGGEHWNTFFPNLVATQLAEERRPDGMWEYKEMGVALDTAFRILSLTPPCQLLPIFQR